MSYQVLDETDVAELLLQDLDNADSIIESHNPDEMRLVDEDLPSNEELQALIYYQIQGDNAEDHDDEVDGIVDELDQPPSPATTATM